MTEDRFRDLPEPEAFPTADELDRDEERLADLTGSVGLDDMDGPVVDLSTDDLMNNGALPEDLEHSNTGRREYEADLVDPAHEDTIDERVRQEEPDADERARQAEIENEVQS